MEASLDFWFSRAREHVRNRGTARRGRPPQIELARFDALFAIVCLAGHEHPVTPRIVVDDLMGCAQSSSASHGMTENRPRSAAELFRELCNGKGGLLDPESA